jgi:hypothetical protein
MSGKYFQLSEERCKIQWRKEQLASIWWYRLTKDCNISSSLLLFLSFTFDLARKTSPMQPYPGKAILTH